MATMPARGDAILDGIRQGKMLKDIAEEQGVSKQVIGQVVTRLLAEGLIKRYARGVYKVNERKVKTFKESSDA